VRVAPTCKAPSASASGSAMSRGSGCPAWSGSGTCSAVHPWLFPRSVAEIPATHVARPVAATAESPPLSRAASARRCGVRERRAAIAFALHSTRMEQLMAVADAGKLMPLKSTWLSRSSQTGCSRTCSTERELARPPGALAAHVGICAGDGEQSASLSRRLIVQRVTEASECCGCCMENRR
jgi:hypothetical protein